MCKDLNRLIAVFQRCCLRVFEVYQARQRYCPTGADHCFQLHRARLRELLLHHLVTDILAQGGQFCLVRGATASHQDAYRQDNGRAFNHIS